MSRLNDHSRPLWTAAIILLSLNLILFSLLIVETTARQRVQYIPDDGFYYLTLARSFATSGQWSFDSGVSLTSGFHLIFAYLLAAIYAALRPSPDSFVTGGILTGLLFTLLSIAALLYWGVKGRNRLFLMFLALVITSENFIYNTISITEWSAGVLISALYWLWFHTRHQQAALKTADFLILFLLGLLSSLARSDSGLLPFALFAAVLLLFWQRQLSRPQLTFAAAGLAGTIAGLILLFAHNYLSAGELLQSSALMKAYWGQFTPPGYHAAPVLIGHIIGVIGLLLLALLLAAVILPRFSKKTPRASAAQLEPAEPSPPQSYSAEDKREFSIMLITSAICFLGYTLFYSRGGGVQPWYSGNLILPVLIFLYALSRYLAQSLSRRATAVFSLLFLGAVLLNLAALYPINSENSVWPYHEYLYDAGIYLRDNPPDSAVGAWNAGIIGYYQGGRVINLDGLVNQDIYPYAVNNNLPAYLAQQNITHILDFERMITDPLYRLRGGYDTPTFTARFTPEKLFDEGDYRLILYRLEGEP